MSKHTGTYNAAKLKDFSFHRKRAVVIMKQTAQQSWLKSSPNLIMQIGGETTPVLKKKACGRGATGQQFANLFPPKCGTCFMDILFWGT
jgi:hypothetical protein